MGFGGWTRENKAEEELSVSEKFGEAEVESNLEVAGAFAPGAKFVVYFTASHADSGASSMRLTRLSMTKSTHRPSC